MMLVLVLELLRFKRKYCYEKLISISATSHHALVDYFTVTASPVMFYSSCVTSRAGTRQGCPLFYFHLAFKSNPYPQLHVKTETFYVFIQEAQC